MPSINFKTARNTIVVSDLHLTEGEPVHPKKPLWKRWKQRDMFIDGEFRAFLETLSSEMDGPIELVLAGDVFDFDSVTALPENPPFRIGWLERRRGLNPDEQKSHFKMRVIITEHSLWFDTLKEFIAMGHRVVFIRGNHDIELFWPKVQSLILKRICTNKAQRKQVRFCDWFYISNSDTLIEHGNQYDAYCVSQNPSHPVILTGHRKTLRLPFGDLTSRYLINGMGYFNPHVEASFLLGFTEYVRFFFKYMIRTQPLLMWTWFWSSMATLGVSFWTSLLPNPVDPLTAEKDNQRIAKNANATPSATRSLALLKVHPATLSPMKILRELWLDRALIVLFVLSVALQFGGTLKILLDVPMLWSVIPLLLIFLPFFVFYTRSIRPKVRQYKVARRKRLKTAQKITGIRRIVNGHTHEASHSMFGDIEYFNTGFWSAPCINIDCSRREQNRHFVWLRPKSSQEREAVLGQWLGKEKGYRLFSK